MTTATMTAPKTTTKADAHTILRFAGQVGRERAAEALEGLARKAGIDAFAHRLRYYGAEWMAVDGEWRSRDVARAVEHVESRICRNLTADERGVFGNAMTEVLYDLV